MKNGDSMVAASGGHVKNQLSDIIPFEKMPIFELFSDTDYNLSNLENHNQLILFE